jgi:hypothetical protein
LALSKLCVERESTAERAADDDSSEDVEVSRMSAEVEAAPWPATSSAAETETAAEEEEAPSPPREPMDPEATRKYCDRISASGRESSNLS